VQRPDGALRAARSPAQPRRAACDVRDRADVGFDARSWLDKLGYPHSENMRVEERYRRVDAATLELVITVTDPEYYTAPWRSDIKRFSLNGAKSRRFDEQIYCIPAEEMTYQDTSARGNVID
jgi:hypothetical protein